MKKLFLFCLLLSLLDFSANAQSPAKYWVQFKDKAHSAYSIAHPEEFLSQRALDRRARLNVAVDETDLPVSQYYIDNLKDVDEHAVVLTKSKWLNGVTVYAEREDALQAFKALPFVTDCQKTSVMKDVLAKEDSIKDYCANAYNFGGEEQHNIISNNDLDYGLATAQVRCNNAHWLHRLGFKGQGVYLTVMDGGFDKADSLRFYQVLRDENRLLGVRNFVQPGGCVFTDDTHGEMVLSCIASYVPGEIIGTAPMVSIYLAKTEDGRTEYFIEEDNWAAGCEWADSLGCDVLSASLGYFIFDDSNMVRKYSDLTGRVSRASRVATMAVKKGLLVVNSAGNAGMRKDWSKIGFPAEAYDILAVGAVDIHGKRTPFSSKGPAVGGRIKPDVCAVGGKTYIGDVKGKVRPSNGTSFAAPLMAGMVVCLRQAFPEKSSYDILNAVRFSGSQASAPDTLMGYGIPDMLKAYNLLQNDQTSQNQDDLHLFKVDFDSYVSTDPKDFPVKVINLGKREKKLTITVTSRNTGKHIKKSFALADGENVLHLKMPVLEKDKKYDILDMAVDGAVYHYKYVIGQESQNK